MGLLYNAEMSMKRIYSMQFFVILFLILQIQDTKTEFSVSTSSLETNNSSNTLPRLSVTSLDVDASASTSTTLRISTDNNSASDAQGFVTQSAAINVTWQATSSTPNTSLQQSDSTVGSTETPILTQEITDSGKDVDHDGRTIVAADYTRADLEQRQRNHAAVSSTLLEPSESAAVLAAIFISVAIVAYVGLVLWRRMLDKHYGNRQLLVDEDYYDVNDLNFFEL